MLKTKLLSVFVAFALMITVGGVYATWNYADGGVNDEDYTGFISLTEEVTGSQKGTLAIDTGATDFEILFDDSDTDNKTHTAVLAYSGKIVVKFTFSENAPQNELEAGINLQFVISNNASLVWHGVGDNAGTNTPIFDVYTQPLYAGQTAEINGETVTIPALTNNATADTLATEYTWELDYTLLQKLIKLRSEDVVVDTLAEYQDLETLLAANKLNINFSEYIAPNT